MLTAGGKASAIDPPDWSAITDTIACPLCEYNLRGLSEPRCPECGHKFEWRDLLDPARRIHPYLFEHHPEKNFRSFIRTAIGGLNPWRFWKTLRPEQPSRPRRMILYWCISIALAACVFAIPYVTSMVGFWQWMDWERRNAPKPPFRDVDAPTPVMVTAATYEAWLDQYYPVPPSSKFFHNWWSRGVLYPQLSRALKLSLLAVIVWPWLTFLALLPFFQTIRLAKVKRIHILRGVTYSFDVGVWLLVGTLVSVGLKLWINRAGRSFAWSPYYSAGSELRKVLPLAALVLIVLACVRLRISMSRYLSFPHPSAVVVSSQIIVVLSILTFFALVRPALELAVRYLWL